MYRWNGTYKRAVDLVPGDKFSTGNWHETDIVEIVMDSEPIGEYAAITLASGMKVLLPQKKKLRLYEPMEPHQPWQKYGVTIDDS